MRMAFPLFKNYDFTKTDEKKKLKSGIMGSRGKERKHKETKNLLCPRMVMW